MSYYDFQGKPHQGNLVVFDAAAPFVLKAFQVLYQQKYPIEQLDAHHETGVTESQGNTSAFNCRTKVGERSFSLHAYGLAIDINVQHNPYIGSFSLDNQVDIKALLSLRRKIAYII